METENKPLLSIKNLRIAFPIQVADGYSDLFVVNDVSLNLGAGEILAVVGESGSGKTMTALATLGLIPSPGLIKSGKIHPILDIVEDITESLQEIPRIIRSAPKITISAVRGYAVGGGFEIAIDSDLIVAAQNAIFGFPEVTAGMTITGGVTKLLPMIVGLNKARELMLTGEFINATEAHRIGLVNRLVPNGEEEKAAEDLARMIISRAPLAVAAHKRMVNQSVMGDFETTLDIEKQTITTMIYTDDYGEAIKAFSEKRGPSFQGR